MSSLFQKPTDLLVPEGISFLSFNKDFTEIALSKKDHIIYIYSIPTLLKIVTWRPILKLESHTQYISGLDWSPETNKILSCSYDKTSFVWEFIDNKWTASRVISNEKLGYICCKWNKRGDKFCEGTSSKQLIIGYYNKISKRWVCNNIKAHKSSVVACEIDPSSLYIISGSTDLKVCISSCYIPEIDDKYLTEENKHLTKDFRQIIYEFESNSWINSVTWLNGVLGLVSCQDATFTIIDLNEQKSKIILFNHSPINILIPNGEKSFYAVCYDRNVLEYEKKDDVWEIKRYITSEKNYLENKKNIHKIITEPKKEFNISNSIKVCRFKPRNFSCYREVKDTIKCKKFPYLHQSLISSVNLKNGEIMISSDLSGFVKFWKL